MNNLLRKNSYVQFDMHFISISINEQTIYVKFLFCISVIIVMADENFLDETLINDNHLRGETLHIFI